MLSFIFAAALAVASPLQARQKTPLDYPPRIPAAAFTLVANITDTAEAATFNPPINNWVLGTERVGAGQHAAVLRPANGDILFINGTARDVSAQATSVLAPPLDTTNGPILLGLQFRPTTALTMVGINYGSGDIGAGIGIGLRDPWAELFPPSSQGSGSFVVCKEAAPAYTRPEYPVLWAKSVSGVMVAPDNCVAINLLAQCAELPTLTGEAELNILKQEVWCYEDVKAIEWSKW